MLNRYFALLYEELERKRCRSGIKVVRTCISELTGDWGERVPNITSQLTDWASFLEFRKPTDTLWYSS